MYQTHQAKKIVPYIITLLIAVSLGAYLLESKGLPKPATKNIKSIHRQITQ